MDTNTTERGHTETNRYRAQRSESWRQSISRSMKARWQDPDYRARCVSNNKPPVTKGENHPNWQGGRHKDKDGYVRLTISPDHPYVEMAQSDGKSLRILEHRLVMAMAIGRPLTPGEVVHHRNGRKQDNRLENLLLLKDKSQHVKLHSLLSKGFTEEEAVAGLDDVWGEILVLLKALGEQLEWLAKFQAHCRSEGSSASVDAIEDGYGSLPWAT